MIELERPLALKQRRTVDVKVLVDGAIGEVYVGGKVAMSTRMYDLKQGRWGVFVRQGTAHLPKPWSILAEPVTAGTVNIL